MNQKKKMKSKKILIPTTLIALISCAVFFIIAFFINSQTGVIKMLEDSFGKNNLESMTNAKYHVSFYDGNGNKVWETEVEEGWTLITEGEPSEEEKTFTYGGEIPKRDNRTFDGWVSSTGSFEITQDTEFTAYFLEDTRYVMTFRYISTNEVIVADTFVTILTIDSQYSYESPKVEGYTPDIEVFEGTLTEDKFRELSKMSNVTMQWENNHTSCTIIITITYEPADSSYKIVHLRQNTQGDGYEKYEEEEIKEGVKVGDIVTSTGREKEYTGFKKNDTLTTSAETVKADGTTEIKIYYDRETYYIYYDSKGGTYYDPQPILYEAPISVVDNPSRDGYRFVNWTWSQTQNGEAITKPDTMPNYDLYAFANWRSVETNYSISYYVENADNDEYSILGEASSKTLSEDKIDLDTEKSNIEAGFKSVIGSGEYSYYTYNREMTVSQNTETDLTINGDGSTIIKVYYKRNTYTLTFHLGTKSGSSYRIYTSTSPSSTTSTTQVVTLNMGEDTYTIGEEEYKITAKYGQNIADLWPTVGLHIQPQSIRATRTYYAYAWLYRKGGSSSYTSQVSGIYTMNKDLIYNNAGSEFYLQWSTSQPNYTVHYMFETLDNSGTLYSGSYSYYKNHYFEENESLQVKVSNTSMGYKTIDGYNYSSSAESERKNYDIYLYYLRNEYTLTFYSINETILPDLSDITLGNGISKGDGVLNIKYGADISELSEAILHPHDYSGSALGTGEWQFEQWYTDINATIPMVWENATMTDSMMLYAKWIAPTYEVTYNTDGGKWLDSSEIYTNEKEGIYKRVVDEETVLTPPIEPTKLGYYFDGWYYIDMTTGDEREVKYLFSESQKVYDNIVLTAKWTPRTDVEYTVKYVEAQFEDGVLITDISKYSDMVEVASPKIVKDNAFGSVVTEDAILVNSKEAGRFYISDARQKTIILDKENDKDNIIYFFYAKVESAKYTVYYVKDTGVKYKEGDIPPREEWLAEPTNGLATELENAIVTVEYQEIAGYVPNALSQTLMLVMDEKLNTIYFYYTENNQQGEYKINFWFMNEQGGYAGEPDYTVSGEMSVGSTIYVTQYGDYLSLSDKRYIGHVLDEDHSDTYSIVTSTEDVAILDIFFKNATYQITFHTQGGTWKQEGEEYKQIDSNTYKTEVTYPNILVRPINPEKQNSELVGWHEVTTGEEKSVSSTKFTYGQPVTRDLDLYLVWKDKKEISIQKIWVDDNDRDGRRPTKIEVGLLQDGAKYKDVDITRNNKIEDNKWQVKSNEYKYNYNNAKVVFVYEENGVKKISVDPMNKEITEILMIADSEKLVSGANLDEVQKEAVYTIEEKEIDDYITEYNQETLTITNTHEVAVTEKSVMKVWEDGDDRDGLRPENITVRLFANGEQYKEDIVLDETNDWQYVWQDLYVYEGGEPIDYTLEEVSVDGYDTHIMHTRAIAQSFIIRNMHDPKTIEKTVTKIWDDGENQDGKRPEKVVVNLLANGEILEEEQVELNQTNDWTHTWTLYKNNEGEEITYKIQEVVPTEYEAEYQEDDQGNVTITNKYTPAKTNKTVTKVWSDKENQDGIRPEKVYVRLYANNQYKEEQILNEQNNWTYEWNNLDVYANGNPIAYRVEEADVPGGYNVSYNQDTLTVTNTHEVEKISKTVTKVWNDSNDQDGKRPESIDVKLYANGTEVQQATLSEANGWTHTWDSLDKNSGGHEILYTAREETKVGEYTTNYNDDTLTITNSYEPKKIDKTVTIKWEDKSNQDGIRPENVKVELYANGTLVGEPITLSYEDFEGDNWQYVWEDLPQYSNKVEIEYKVKQTTNVGEYTTTYSDDTFTITNSYTPKVADKTVTKIWRDADDKEHIRPQSVTLQLYANGEPVQGPVTLTVANATEGTNNWKYTWKNLDVYAHGEPIVYTVKEPTVPDKYGVLYNQKTLTVYNAFPPEVDVDVTKIWEDEENADGKRPESITVQLKADDENYVIDGVNVGKVELNEANNWTYKWGFIEKYNGETEEKYHYSVEEIDPITDYETSYKAIADEEDSEYEYQFEIINTHPVEKIKRTVKKEWDDNENQDGKRPAQITVNLLADEQIVDTVTLNDANGWTYTWEAINKNKLGEEINYTVEEVEVNGYTSSVEYDDATQTFTIKNHHDIEKVKRTVTKQWNDQNDQDGKRPADVTVQLKANNVASGEPVVLTQAEGWTHTWENLDKYQGGDEIEYTVEEIEVPGYTTQYKQDEDKNIIIENTHTPSKINKTVKKEWSDNNDQDGIRLHSVFVVLKANGVVCSEEVELKQENGWTYTWQNLDEYENKNKIIYEVEEKTKIEGYTASYKEDESGTITVTNSHTPYTVKTTVTKQWQDNENQDGKRPESIQIQLKADGTAYGESVILNNANEWSYTYDNLPERKVIETQTGKTVHYIEYTVEEIVPQGYQASYKKDSTGNITITNTHTPEKEQKQVNVYWVDKNNANNTRPIDITIQLYANGEPYGEEVILGTKTDMTNIWEDIDKFSGGAPITYTVRQKDEITGYTTTYSEDENGILTITNTLNQYDYTVKYYYDGKINTEKTENLRAYYGDKITTYTNNQLKNYHFVEDKNIPLIITTDKNQNIIEVFYERDENQVQIKYVDKYTNEPVAENVTLKGKIGDPYDIVPYEREVSDYTLVQWPEEKTGVFEEDPIEKTYYYAKNTKVTAKYLEKGTNQVLDAEEVITGHQGKAYTTKKREIGGYTFVESTKNTEGEMPREESEVIYYYAENTEVIVKYVDRANKEIITEEDEYIIKGYEGKEYSAEQKKIEGYTFVDKTENAEGTMTKEPQKVTMYYAKNSKVKVKYLEKSSNKVLKEEKIEGYEGKEYKTEQKKIEGYTFIEATNNTQGNMEREDIEVTYYYAQNSIVRVQHIDKENNKVLKEVIIEGKEGDVVKTSAIEIEGYVLKEAPKNENVTMTKQEIIVKYYYSHISQGVIEKHIDDVTGEILYSKTHEGAKGDSYEIKAKEFEGYDLVEEKLPNNSKGTMTEETIEVIYYYVKRAQVRVQYIDKQTDEQIEKELIKKGHEGDKYKTEQKEIENYVFVESTDNTEGEMQVKVNEDGTFNIEIIVKYYYIKKSKGVVENYIDEATGKILETKEYTGKVGDSYITYPKEFAEYDLLEEKIPQNAQGTMQEELIEVNYYYIQKAKVTVQYIDVQTKETLYEEEILGHEKDKYETKQREFDNYDIVKEKLPQNKTGEMTKENIVVKYYYIRKTEVEVKYIEKETGIVIAEKQIIVGHVEDSYESKPKEIKYYKFVESTENAKGKMTKQKITVIHYYEKLIFNMQVSTEGIIKDGVTALTESDLYKIEIPSQEIGKTNMKITYLIRIKNIGQIEGYVEELKTKIPEGFTFRQEENNLNWKNDGGIITTTDLKEKQLKPEEYIDIQLVLRWVGNDDAIFGAAISEFTLSKLGNPALFEDINLKNNTSDTTILMSIKTGEDNSLIIKVITSIISVLTLVAVILWVLIKRNNKKIKTNK